MDIPFQPVDLVRRTAWRLASDSNQLWKLYTDAGSTRPMKRPSIGQLRKVRWSRLIAILGSCLIAAVLIGIVYEQIGRRRERHDLKQVGQSIDVGGRTLNLHCVGRGGPAVVFESGGAGPGLTWQPMQDEVAKFTRSCWYDRAGEGWSDPGPHPRTSVAIAKDLHELLGRAGEPSPFVLVGASFGGLNARVYGHLYPKDCVGFVLIDSAHEDEPLRAPPFYLAPAIPRYFWGAFHLAFTTAAYTGLIRLMQSSMPHGAEELQPERDQLIARLRNQPKSIAANALTGIVMAESLAEARSVTSLGDRPLIVLAAGKPLSFGDAAMDRAAQDYQRTWIGEMQPKLAKLSTRGRLIVFPNSDHTSIPPEATLAAIREIVFKVRTQDGDQ